MKKYTKSFLIALTVFILIPAISVLAGYTSSISVQNTGATGYGMVSVNMSANVTYWESDGFIGANGTDVRIYRGTVAIPHMMVTDRITMSLPLPAYSSQTLQFVTGETPQDFYIVPGYSSNSSVGRVHVADNPNIELGNSFSVNMADIYLNTANGTDKNILRKDDALKFYVSDTAAGTATISISPNVASSTIRPTGAGDLSELTVIGAATGWQATSDSNDGTYVMAGQTYLTDLYQIEDIAIVFPITSITLYFRTSEANASYITSMYPVMKINGSTYTGSVQTTSNTAPTDRSQTWTTNPNTGVAWTKNDVNNLQAGIALKTSGAAGTPRCHEYWIVVTYGNLDTVITGISSGEYDVSVSANTTHLTLDIGGSSNSTALGGVSVPDNANDWYLFENNSVAYCKTFEIQRNVVQQLYYAPNDIIDGTSGILPDRGSDGADNYGVILFGSNPENIALTLGAFESDYTVDTTITGGVVEVAPEVTISTLTKEDAVKIAELSVKDPALYPLISAINGAVNIPIMFMYQGVFFALAVGLLFLFGKFGHLTVGVIATLVVIGFATAWGVYDVVMLVILIIAGIGLILMQGRQSA